MDVFEFTIKMDAKTIARIAVGRNGESGYRLLDGKEKIQETFSTSDISKVLESLTEPVVKNMVLYGAVKAATNER